MTKRFVVMSGLPGSGKTTIGRQLAASIGLAFIDKDDILDRLFESRGVGDAQWRRTLSRDSDAILQAEAAASRGAVLVSHWRLAGMSAESGTPTDWLRSQSNVVVNVRCVCPPALATARFVSRSRHPGHRDAERSRAEIQSSIVAVAALPPLDLGFLIEVDASESLALDVVVRRVAEAFETPSL
ncbi:MAG: AAA family ATPase [Acidobacteriota bacterium]